MRALYAFVAFVGASMALSDVVAGRWADAWPGALIAAVAGGLLVRALMDPEVTRRAGMRAKVFFSLEPGAGVAPPGTFARVETHKCSWHVALDRAPQREDFEVYDMAQRGWVWLGADAQPEKLRVNYGSTWKSWPVTSAALADAQRAAR